MAEPILAHESWHRFKVLVTRQQGQVVAKGNRGNQGVNRFELPPTASQRYLEFCRQLRVSFIRYIAGQVRSEASPFCKVLRCARQQPNTKQNLRDHRYRDRKAMFLFETLQDSLPQRMAKGDERRGVVRVEKVGRHPLAATFSNVVRPADSLHFYFDGVPFSLPLGKIEAGVIRGALKRFC